MGNLTVDVDAQGGRGGALRVFPFKADNKPNSFSIAPSLSLALLLKHRQRATILQCTEEQDNAMVMVMTMMTLVMIMSRIGNHDELSLKMMMIQIKMLTNKKLGG